MPEADQNDDANLGKAEIEGLRAAVQAERRQRQEFQSEVAELRGLVKGLTATRPAEKAEPLTRAQLLKAVDDEKMTQEEADTLWERRIVAKAKSEAVAETTRTIDTSNALSRVGGQIARYKTAIPDLEDKESAAFQKASREFTELVSLGYDREDPRTEVAALRAAFGSVETLGKGERDTFKETGGRGGDETPADGWPKDMPAPAKAYYQDLINKGMYTRKSAIEEYRYKPQHRPRVA